MPHDIYVCPKLATEAKTVPQAVAYIKDIGGTSCTFVILSERCSVLPHPVIL
jgi:hypothetical protein